MARKICIRPPTKQVSSRMRQVRRTGSKIEREMRNHLHRLKIKYEFQPKIYGHPDFKLKKTNVLIFCDSSFWHGRRNEDRTGETIKRNKTFWVNKLNENRKRDLRTNRYLRNNGYSVHRFWDTNILKKPAGVERRLRRISGLSNQNE